MVPRANTPNGPDHTRSFRCVRGPRKANQAGVASVARDARMMPEQETPPTSEPRAAERHSASDGRRPSPSQRLRSGIARRRRGTPPISEPKAAERHSTSKDKGGGTPPISEPEAAKRHSTSKSASADGRRLSPSQRLRSGIARRQGAPPISEPRAAERHSTPVHHVAVCAEGKRARDTHGPAVRLVRKQSK